MKQINWKYIALFILAIPVINQLGSILGNNSAPHITEKVKASTAQADDQSVRIVVASQDAEGVTQKDLNLNFLKRFETLVVRRTKVNAKKYLVSQGYPNAKIDINSESTYVYSGLIKLIVIRLSGSDGSNQVLITGIISNEFKRVVCVRDSKKKIPITYGVCADKIKEVFGTKIGA